VRKDDPKGKQYAAKLTRHGKNKLFDIEIDILRRLNHPRIANLVDSYKGGRYSSSVMIMELIPGGTLKENFAKLMKNPDKAEVRATMLSWFKQTNEGLAYIHS